MLVTNELANLDESVENSPRSSEKRNIPSENRLKPSLYNDIMLA